VDAGPSSGLEFQINKASKPSRGTLNAHKIRLGPPAYYGPPGRAGVRLVPPSILKEMGLVWRSGMSSRIANLRPNLQETIDGSLPPEVDESIGCGNRCRITEPIKLKGDARRLFFL